MQKSERGGLDFRPLCPDVVCKYVYEPAALQMSRGQHSFGLSTEMPWTFVLFLLPMISETTETRVVFGQCVHSGALLFLILSNSVSYWKLRTQVVMSQWAWHLHLAERAPNSKRKPDWGTQTLHGTPDVETVFWLLLGLGYQTLFGWSQISHCPCVFLRSGSALVFCAVSVEKMLWWKKMRGGLAAPSRGLLELCRPKGCSIRS